MSTSPLASVARGSPFPLVTAHITLHPSCPCCAFSTLLHSHIMWLATRPHGGDFGLHHARVLRRACHRAPICLVAAMAMLRYSQGQPQGPQQPQRQSTAGLRRQRLVMPLCRHAGYRHSQVSQRQRPAAVAVLCECCLWLFVF